MENKKYKLRESNLRQIVEYIENESEIGKRVDALEKIIESIDVDEISNEFIDKSKSFKIQLEKPFKIMDLDGNCIEIEQSKEHEIRTSTRNKCEQFVEEKLAYRSYGFETPKYYAELIADIIDILVYKNVPRDRICGVLYDVERVIPLVVTF